MDCLFCKIIAGEIPAYKVYENDNVLAFLDITPKTLGHTLVIPKKHYKDLLELNKDEFNYIEEIQNVANILREMFAYDGINLVNNCGSAAGQEVFHAHFHLIPQYKDETINEEKNNFEQIMLKLNK